MNKTEQRFRDNVLVPLLATGEILGFEFEPFKLRLGPDWKTSYTPDFVLWLASGEIELVDVKGSGGWEEHTRIKIKTAAEKYPQFHFVGQTEQRGKRGLCHFDREEF